jgi:type I restriction-modification system DNA methylase subunit
MIGPWETKRNVIFFKKRNETKRNGRILFLEPKPKTKTKKIFFRNETERNEKKITFFNSDPPLI